MESIHQPLCNLQVYTGFSLEFFAEYPYNKGLDKDNRRVPYIPAGNMFYVKEISFVVDGYGASDKVLKHLLGYGYFIFRVCDRDYLVSPCMIMGKFPRCLVFRLLIPICIPENMTYKVILEFSKKMKHMAKIMCVLDGEMVRRSV